MTNISAEFISSTLIPPFNFTDCLNGIHFGFIFLCCILTFCFLFGTPANSWYLWFYFCTERKVKQTHVFLLNHIIADLIFCLECALQMVNMFVFRNNEGYKVIYFFLYLSWSGRPLIQTCICIEQYLAVLHPVIFLRYKALKYRIAAVVAAWFVSLGYTLYHITTLSFPDPIINSVFIIALIIISFCCVSVLRALKQPGPGDTRTTNLTGKDVGNRQKRNAFNTIFSSLLLILFTYTPQALLSVFTNYINDQILMICNISTFMSSLTLFGAMVTPFLKMYKEGHLKCLKCRKEIKGIA